MHETILQRIANEVMEARGLATRMTPEQEAQLDAIRGAADAADAKDLRDLPWCSIDNDDSLDLDQLTVHQPIPNGDRILVAVADVDALVPLNTPLDAHARQNTTTVYTAPQVFYMLPERLTTNLTSLNFNQDRLALIIQMDVDESGQVVASDVYRGRVCNRAKLAYNPTAQWLENRLAPPHEVAAADGMAEQLRVQDKVAQRLRERRHEQGALELQTLEPRAQMSHGEVVDMRLSLGNRAKELIEDFMVAANGVTARFLVQHGCPSLRRVVRTPKRWDRIVEVAEARNFHLPAEPDSKALSEFLAVEKGKDALRFPDLSLTIVKLMGPGEYAVERPGEEPPGHFGLAVRDYSHSTAPNRRYPDLITHRLLKAVLAGQPSPYAIQELEELAVHCTLRENDVQKVERRVQKSASALLLSHYIGTYYDAIVTGVNPDGKWCRLLHPPVEGKLVDHDRGHLDVGDRIRVKLIHTDVERGFVDFVLVK